MTENKYPTVPQWVRSTICVVGCFSIPALLLTSLLGNTLNPYLTAVVGLFAIRTSKFAFVRFPPNHRNSFLVVYDLIKNGIR